MPLLNIAVKQWLAVVVGLSLIAYAYHSVVNSNDINIFFSSDGLLNIAVNFLLAKYIILLLL